MIYGHVHKAIDIKCYGKESIIGNIAGKDLLAVLNVLMYMKPLDLKNPRVFAWDVGNWTIMDKALNKIDGASIFVNAAEQCATDLHDYKQSIKLRLEEVTVLVELCDSCLESAELSHLLEIEEQDVTNDGRTNSD